jgi:hypothetical protein
MVMVALGTTAPDASATVPWIEPSPAVCAHAMRAIEHTQNNSTAIGIAIMLALTGNGKSLFICILSGFIDSRFGLLWGEITCTGRSLRADRFAGRSLIEKKTCGLRNPAQKQQAVVSRRTRLRGLTFDLRAIITTPFENVVNLAQASLVPRWVVGDGPACPY